MSQLAWYLLLISLTLPLEQTHARTHAHHARTHARTPCTHAHAMHAPRQQRHDPHAAELGRARVHAELLTQRGHGVQLACVRACARACVPRACVSPWPPPCRLEENRKTGLKMQLPTAVTPTGHNTHVTVCTDRVAAPVAAAAGAGMTAMNSQQPCKRAHASHTHTHPAPQATHTHAHTHTYVPIES